MLSKKGDFMSENTGGILLAIIGFIIVAVVLFFVFGKGEALENFACKTTVYFSDQTLGIGKTVSFNPILCRTHYKKMEDMKDLAESMVTTWSVFGEGKLDPTGNNWLLWTQKKCFKLYRGEVTGELDGVTREQFIKFLESEGDIDGKTYWNYFNKKSELDFNRVVVAFDQLKEKDFVGVFYFEEVETNIFNPLSYGYNILQFLLGDIEDVIIVARDNDDERLECTEIY